MKSISGVEPVARTDVDLGAVAGLDGHRAGGIVDFRRRQRVERHLGSGFTGEVLLAVEVVNAGQQLLGLEQRGAVDLEISSDQLLIFGIEAESAEQHLAELIALQGVVRTEGAVAVAGNDALAGAVGDGAFCPVADGVGEVGSAGHILHIMQIADDLRGFCAGQGALRVELEAFAVGLAVDDSDTGQERNGLFVGDLLLIGEVNRVGADRAQADHHDKAENQAKSLLKSSHDETPPLSSTPFGA